MLSCKGITKFCTGGTTAFYNRKAVFFLLLMSMLFVIPAQGALVGHWKLDESSGTSASDSSGNGYTGTLQNMAGNEWVSGMIDGALDFDGTNDYVSMPRASVLETGNSSNHNISASVCVAKGLFRRCCRLGYGCWNR